MNNFKRWLLVYAVYPFVKIICKIVPKLTEKYENKLIEYNNLLVKGKSNFKKIMLLLPHCLQQEDCKHRLIKNILNCEQCGKCKICEIVKIGKKYDITIKVATGGRLAKRFVEEINPQIVVAVACERELIEGIVAVYPVKVIGITNMRPEGPCINTTVDVEKIEKTLKEMLL